MASGIPASKYPSDPYKRPWEEHSPKSPYVSPTPAKTLESFFNDMFFLGFSDQLNRWSSLANINKPASFPPYNLIKIDDDNWKVELAVAGYSKDDIVITVERDQLIVASKDNEEDENSTVIYQGIAQRSWRQKFILGEYMQVTGASMKDGLLIITVERELPEEAKPKTIKIK